ncbi:hypothetical protein C9426_16870 [Serratia sp. S1B]|nr:hypothetical protein C9426_16870 [Serratia sp. S1B]
MSYLATTTGISSDMVCDVLVHSIEKRFGTVNYLPHRIEWLTDNGSCYIAKSTREFAHALGCEIGTTPIRSPQRNRMAESFVKTFKRDYVYLNDLPDANSNESFAAMDRRLQLLSSVSTKLLR